MKKFLSSMVFWTVETFKTFGNFLFYVSVAGIFAISVTVIMIEQLDMQATKPAVEEVTLDGNTN